MQQERTEVARALDPISLFQQLVRLQQAVFRCAVDSSPFLSSPLADPLHIFAVEQCTAANFLLKGVCLLRMQGWIPCTESRSGENGCIAFGVPTKIPMTREWDKIFSWLQANPER
jgi:hypothetical protein